MTFRIRKSLATLAICLVPSLGHAQQYSHQCSTAPVALEARLSLTGNGWDPAATIAALIPSGEQVRIAMVPNKPPSPDGEQTGSSSPVNDKGCTYDCAEQRQRCAAVSEPSGQASEDHELLGVDYCVPEASRKRMDIAKEIAELARQEPIDATYEESASSLCSDSPVVVSLAQQEEYLSYDLTAIDRVKMRIFPFGIPRYQGRVHVPMLLANHAASTDIKSEEATVALPAEDKVAEPFIPIDCLLDEFVWQISLKLRPGSPLRQSLHPHRIGQRLEGVMSSASGSFHRLVNEIAVLVPTVSGKPVYSNLPQPIQLAGQPSVCCPFNPETHLVEAHADVAADRTSDTVDRIIAAYAGSWESDVEVGLDGAGSEEASTDVAADQSSDVVDRIVAAYAGSWESDVEVGLDGAGSEEATTDVAADQPSDVVDRIVAAYAGSWESEGEVALERAMHELQKVVEVVQSLSDRWNQRIATQPESTSVR